jgi:hypothetical protein
VQENLWTYGGYNRKENKYDINLRSADIRKVYILPVYDR